MPSPKICRCLAGLPAPNTYVHFITFSLTTRVESYQTASFRAVLTSNGQQRSSVPDYPALNLIQTLPEDRGSSKNFYRQVSKLRRTHHHGLSINKTLTLHRNNESVIFITSDSSSPSIHTIQKFREETRLKRWLSASCDLRYLKRQ